MDCADVAVKLAGGFNLNPLNVFDEQSIKKHQVVVRVSNLLAIDSTIIEDKIPIPARVKQASSIMAQEEFMKVQIAIDQKLDMMKETKSHIHDALKQRYLGIMTASMTHIDTLRSLVDLDYKFNRILTDELSASHQDLQQKLDDYLVECIGQLP